MVSGRYVVSLSSSQCVLDLFPVLYSVDCFKSLALPSQSFDTCNVLSFLSLTLSYTLFIALNSTTLFARCCEYWTNRLIGRIICFYSL